MAIEKIQAIHNMLPGVQSVSLFYDNGIIYQTTINHELDIPVIGKNLAHFVQEMQLLAENCKDPEDKYQKMTIDTEKSVYIILRLGEQSNMALKFIKAEYQKNSLGKIEEIIEKLKNVVDLN